MSAADRDLKESLDPSVDGNAAISVPFWTTAAVDQVPFPASARAVAICRFMFENMVHLARALVSRRANATAKL